MSNAPQQYPGQPAYAYPGNGPALPPPKRKKPWYKRVWVWALIVVAVIIIATVSNSGGGDSSSTSSPAASQVAAQGQAGQSATDPTKTAATQAAKPKDKLTLDDGWQLDKSNPYMLQVNGYVSNNTNKPINNYIQITFDELDSAGANLGTCLANTNTIDANGKWKFSAGCDKDPDEVATVRLKDITGF
ncbi:FxLYD domain-containing protein [Propionibacterium sp.]|uniref:FxLYD domain-containing protein n=1 Tax=Propionibacterium sp. TaxID=1977903 RepID=UPI0039ED88A9